MYLKLYNFKTNSLKRLHTYEKNMEKEEYSYFINGNLYKINSDFLGLFDI